MMRYPLMRLLVGLSIGFVGAVATILTIDVIERSTRSSVDDAVLGEPDFSGYCGDFGMDALTIGDGLDRWRCTGRLNGIVTITSVPVDDVCRAQFGAAAVARSVEPSSAGWRCIEAP